MPRITRNPEERRQEILDTALRLFCEKGYERTSMADIASAMHVAQGLCYRYFPSKEALFDTAVDRYAGVLADRITEGLKAADPTLRQLVEQTPGFLDAEADDSCACKLCHGPECEKIHRQLSLAVCLKLLPIIKERLDLAKARGELDLDDTETTASFVVFGQLGTLLRTDLSGQERVARIRSFLRQLFFPA